jgi:hypothetical protein
MNPDAIVEPENPILDAINSAEDLADPLAGLVEKAASDPGAPFMPEALEALAALRQDNRAAFEALRSQLKKAGCRVTALDDAIAEESGDTGGRGPTQADILIDLAQTVELFHTPDSAGFADLDINGHRETWPIRAKGFRRWLARRFFEETGGAPSSEALQSALNVIEAKAHFDAPERQVHIRVGGLDGRLYLDLGDETWRSVEIDATGWRVIDNPPVRFRRASGMKPMPIDDGSKKKPHYYQVNAINAAIEAIAKGQDRVLLVMATGTGKTYTAFQIIWRLWKAGRKKRILFLADRNVLIDQTMVNDFRPFGAAMAKLSTNSKTIGRQDGTTATETRSRTAFTIRRTSTGRWCSTTAPCLRRRSDAGARQEAAHRHCLRGLSRPLSGNHRAGRSPEALSRVLAWLLRPDRDRRVPSRKCRGGFGLARNPRPFCERHADRPHRHAEGNRICVQHGLFRRSRLHLFASPRDQ